MLYHQRYSTDFQKFSFCWKMRKNRYLGRKFHGRSYFNFAMIRWKLFSGKKFEISRFQAVHFVTENAISPKVFNRFSKIFLSVKDSENRYLGQKFHGCSYFMFCNGKVKTFFWWKNSKFPTFKLYTVSEKMLYHQRYSTDFQKLSFRWRMWKIGIWAKNFMSAAILVLQW